MYCVITWQKRLSQYLYIFSFSFLLVSDYHFFFSFSFLLLSYRWMHKKKVTYKGSMG